MHTIVIKNLGIARFRAFEPIMCPLYQKLITESFIFMYNIKMGNIVATIPHNDVKFEKNETVIDILV